MRPNLRIDPIFPVVQSVREAPEREAGRLAFGGIIEDRKSLPAQLPLLPTPEGPRVPILELSDWRGVPTMARGRGAPLDLRLAVGACVLTPHGARAARGRLVVTVRELRDFLFPNGWERWRDWPRIREALFRARDYVLPVGGGNWLPFALRWEPGENAELDDPVLIDVELPPGASHGPVIDRRELARLGLRSAPQFRAYIAAHSVAWRPGVTRRRHPRNRDVHLWSSDPANYPVLTTADRRRLAFGAQDKGNRTRADQDAAWEDLAGVEIFTGTPCRGYRPAPPRHATHRPEYRKSRGNPLPDTSITHPVGRSVPCPDSVGPPSSQPARSCNRQCVEPSACRACEAGSERMRCTQSPKSRAFLTSSAEYTFSLHCRRRSSTSAAR